MVVQTLLALAAMAGPGDHIRLGALTITPDVDFGIELRNNTYRSADWSVPGGNLRLAPGVEMKLDGDNTKFELAGEWELRKFLFLTEWYTGRRAVQIRGLDRYDDFKVDSKATLNAKGPVLVLLSESIGLQNNGVDRGLAGRPYVSQLRNELGLGLRLKPASTLELIPNGEWAMDEYRIPDVERNRARFNLRNTWTQSVEARWTFLPRSALVTRGNAIWNNWAAKEVDVLDTAGLPGLVLTPNSTHLKVWGGLESRFTAKLHGDLFLGVGQADYVDPAPGVAAPPGSDLPATFIGALELRYQSSEDEENRTELAAGIQRDFTDGFFTNWIRHEGAYGRFSQTIWRFQPELHYEIRFEDYGGAVTRSDILNRVKTQVRRRIGRTGSVTARLAWQQRAIRGASWDSLEYDEVVLGLDSTWEW